MHCKDKIPKFRNKYSQKRNIGVSVPISTFMCLWAVYLFPPAIGLLILLEEICRPILGLYKYECWNWGWGKGIHKWDFRCSVEAGWGKDVGGGSITVSIWQWICFLCVQCTQHSNTLIIYKKISNGQCFYCFGASFRPWEHIIEQNLLLVQRFSL